MKRFRCACGREIFFDNTRCLHCKKDVGFLPKNQDLVVHAAEGLYEPVAEPDTREIRPCQNAYIGVCNWLIDSKREGDATLCCSCRLTRVVPDLSVPQNVQRLAHVESAKRRLLFDLMTLGVPVPSKTEDPAGLTFEILAELGEQKVMIGHANGVITISLAEADPVHRERERCRLGESYRTVLGHLRHEVGHFYFDRLIAGTSDLPRYRVLFGDERRDYSAALERHYKEGPPADWQERYISAYASAHPWEDWAETWAHYLHACAAVHTATEHGVRDEDPKAAKRVGDVLSGKRLSAAQFRQFVDLWTRTATVMNELNRSLGAHEPYPFVLAEPVVEKLHFVHETVRKARAKGKLPKVAAPAPTSKPTAEVVSTLAQQSTSAPAYELAHHTRVLTDVRVLMIDDAYDFASPIAQALKHSGCEVQVCADGTSGLVGLEQFCPQVVLLDMELPDMHGLQIARTARTGGYTGILIGLSARADEALMRQVQRSTLDHFVPKPCDIYDLRRLIADEVSSRFDANLARQA